MPPYQYPAGYFPPSKPVGVQQRKGLSTTAPIPGPVTAPKPPQDPNEGISEDEVLRIKRVTGTPQPTASRVNVAGEQAAREAAFARSKEQSGRIAASSLEGLRNSMSRRGISGGGYAQMKGAEALAPATDKLQDFTREQLIQDLGSATHNADMDYQGQITQRGQDQSMSNALMSLINSRGRLY